MSDPTFWEALYSTPLLQRAMVSGALAGICCASLSPLVVLRRMAFIGDGMAHAAFGGLGLALFLIAGSKYTDWTVQLLTLAFSLVLAVLIGRVSRRQNGREVSEDSAIGIAFSVSMALGATLIMLRHRREPQYVPAIDSYLFGNLMNIAPHDVWVLLGVAVAVLAMLVLLRKEILFYTFNAELAELSGVRVGLVHYLLLILLVLTVVVSARVVGIVLISASVVLPGVVALRLSRHLLHAALIAALFGGLTFVLGFYAAYELGIHLGSAIVLTQFIGLLLAQLVRR